MATDSQRNSSIGGIFRALGGVRSNPGDAELAGVGADRLAMNRPETPSDAVSTRLAAAPIPTRRAMDADELAAEFLRWLQGPGGRTGAITDGELRQALAEMCAALDIEPIGWMALARKFRALIGDRRRYRVLDGRRRRVYHIQPRQPVSRPDLSLAPAKAAA